MPTSRIPADESCWAAAMGVGEPSGGADTESGSARCRAKRPGDQGLKGYFLIPEVLIYSVFPAPHLPRGGVNLLTPRADEMRAPASMNEL
jgi:hypothetical protein